MKYRKYFFPSLFLLSMMFLLWTMPVFASELTEADVEQTVASQGQETVTGNIFIWFLCAIAFLKVSQKIDSFLASLGVNVGNTGGNMMAELLIASKSLSGALRGHGGRGNYRTNASPGAAAVGGNFLSGGLAGSVGRQAERSAVNAATGHTENSSIGNTLYQSSLNKGGDFANSVISNIAKGNYGQVGSITGEDAVKAYRSYMGLPPSNGPQSSDGSSVNPNSQTHPVPSYNNVEIGGGRITGTETSEDNIRDFAMYHADQYMAPTQGDYETLQSVDGATWYKQYAQDTVSKTPYEKEDRKIAYQESIVQKLPPTPPRKDRI